MQKHNFTSGAQSRRAMAIHTLPLHYIPCGGLDYLLHTNHSVHFKHVFILLRQDYPRISRPLDCVLAFKRTAHDSDRYEYLHPLNNNASTIRPKLHFLGILCCAVPIMTKCGRLLEKLFPTAGTVIIHSITIDTKNPKNSFRLRSKSPNTQYTAQCLR